MTPHRWQTVFAGAAAFVAAMGLASELCCTPQARAPMEAKLSSALTDEQLACLIANHVGGPADVHTAIVVTCEIAPELTGFAIALLQMADKARMGADGGAP